ncbi:MAG: hypothetical protein H0Z29_10450 [Candidatus Marinimicrobia bacterium]|nr:hypothetical protein [Candidatus Neomarinimicrobiota bacterium]
MEKVIKLINVILIITFLPVSKLHTQQLFSHNDLENYGIECSEPPLLSIDELSIIESLPDLFEWSDGSGRINKISEWRCRRAEIVEEIQHYQLGYKPPPPDALIATFTPGDSTIRLSVIDNNDTLNLTAYVFYLPSGKGPFPAIILTGGFPTIPLKFFTSRNIVVVSFRWWELAPWQRNSRSEGAFFQFYPELQYAGSMLAWAWGVSRLIDAIYELPELKVDTAKIGVTGCSFAGKIAIYSAVLDERIALTIAQEPGCGGSASWRVAEVLPGSREKLSNALWAGWYHQNLGQFSSCVTKLPYDHHEVMGAIAPRPLLVLGNPDFEWLAEEATYVACKATKEIYRALGVPDRFGFSQAGGHDHCALPESQYSEVEAFLDKFLLDINSVNTDIEKTPYNDIDLSEWIKWDTPTLK